jgi:hypothetical protein
VRGYLALDRVSGSLPLEVLIDGVALHEIAPRSAHRADNDFLVLEGDCKGRRAILQKLRAKRA